MIDSNRPTGGSRRAAFLGIAAVAGALALQGCDTADRITAPTTATAGAAMPQPEAYATVARALAMSLSDPRVAEALYARVHGSTLREGRLDLAGLTGVAPGSRATGTSLLTSMSREGGADVDAAVRQVVDLSLVDVYFPVPAHRESWKPGSELLVAYAPGENAQALPAFNARGEQVLLDLKAAPSTPVLIVTPTEGVESRTPGASRFMVVCDVDCIDGGGGGGGGGGYGGITYAPRYRSAQGYGLSERIIEHQVLPDVEYWFEGGPETGVSIISHQPSPYNASVPMLTNYMYLTGGDDEPNWYGDNHELWRWNQEYGDYFTLIFWEADAGINTGTITINGHNYGYQRPSSQDALGQVTYSWNDVNMQVGVGGGHGINKWGGDTGRIRFVTDYVTP